MLFSAIEREYVASQPLGRLATIDAQGTPYVVPVGFRLNADDTIDIGGPNLSTSQKFRNVERDARVAFVIDDTTPDDETEFKPGIGRGIEIRGRAEALFDEEPPALGPSGFFSREVIRIHPERAQSWHVDPQIAGLKVLRSVRL